MTRREKQCALSVVLCGVDDITNCPHKCNGKCKLFGLCRIEDKTDEQLSYILAPIDKCIYLEACAGSGKTEVLGMKAAYEISQWQSKKTGIAVLTFTNDAADTIANRIHMFYHTSIPSNHYVGTFSSFVHGHIAQRFGYMFYRTQPETEDKSFRIIDANIDLYDNQWLQNYKLNFPLSSTIYANQLIYLSGKRDWFVGSGENSISITDRYNSKETQQLINSIREKKHEHGLFQLDYLRERIKDCKLGFFQAGFANFEDMNSIAVKCLRNSEICKAIAQKFPLIMVDECQDLSATELSLLGLLIDAGVKVHYIGDLHQAIYSFKDALPEYFIEHIAAKAFEKQILTDNFRSTQSIVDISKNIAAITSDISGKVESQYNADCFYIEYASEQDAIIAFKEMLKERGIQFEKAVVLTRNQTLKMKISTDVSNVLKKYPIIYAIQLWNSHAADGCLMALRLLGGQLQKWYGFQGRSNNFYYPEALCKDAITWRLLLRDIMAEFVSVSSISNMAGKTYSSWTAGNKKQIVAILNKHLEATLGTQLDGSASFVRAVRGTGSEVIGLMNQIDPTELKVETIHAVKGRTFDAVLLMSSANARGKTGYWESWLTPSDEAARIAYVACSRPRSLLCWGVHTLTGDQKGKLEHLGLEPYNNGTKE